MSSEKDVFVQVAVAAPVRKQFTYRIPGSYPGAPRVGQLVDVPFGKKSRRGILTGLTSNNELEDIEIKPLSGLVTAEPVLSEVMIDTLVWATNYYLAPPGEMIFAALPPSFKQPGKSIFPAQHLVVGLTGEPSPESLVPVAKRAPLQARLLGELANSGPVDVARLAGMGSGVRQALRALEKKGLVRFAQRQDCSKVRTEDLPLPEEIKRLTDAQAGALDELNAAQDGEAYAAFLLHGVTGSGKTEVYLRAIAHALDRSRNAILLVPEISLTPQLLSRVAARFGLLVAVLHSGLSSAERLHEWWRLRRGEARVALGARSAVFAPLCNVGIIVVDEEHDPSYKQSERLPYNGRDLAMVRAREERAVVVMGTATPTVESYSHAIAGRSRLLRLAERVHERPMPTIEVIDLKKDLPDPIERLHTVSRSLAEALAETLDRGEQAILFLNRRGFSSFALCKDCGQSIRCSNCSVALVHHRSERRLRCHYCGLSIPVPKICPACGSGRMQLLGLGTEKCEDEVRRRFPGARVLRLDSDSTARRGSVQRRMAKFARGEADVLVGTQMVTKGHDIPGVTLVGVLLADLGLNLPDFRAHERTFQLLVQVAGRAGRGKRPGRVIIQTFLPQHECIVLATRQDFEGFFKRELRRREALGYPPAKKLMLVRVSHPDRGATSRFASLVAEDLRREGKGRITVLGPAESPLARLRDRFRWQMLVKAQRVRDLLSTAAAVQQRSRVPAGAKILFDVDPQDML
ncbi:MAG TPA: primosomal protein N' [Myxococcota bacterium]|nr:primosomal protein N' [Myxococcota bacterium]